jgi:type IV pilus assembly protein PilC
MGNFKYKARDETGRLTLGKMVANSPGEVAERLHASGYVPTEIKEELFNLFTVDLFSAFNNVSPRELLILTSQLANCVNAGITLIRTLEVMASSAKNPALVQLLKNISEDLKGGYAFHQSLAKYPKVFSTYYVSLVQVGEISGKLGETLERLAGYIEKQEELNQKIVSAFAYPTFILFLATGAIFFLLTGIMPKFIMIFKENGVQLPLATTILLGISNFLSHNFIMMFILIILCVVIFRAFLETAYGRLQFDRLKIKMPILGNVFLKVYTSRFVSTMALLYNSGVTILNSLVIWEATIGNRVIADVIKNMHTRIKEGRNLTEPLKESGIFPPEIVMMVGAGEESGQLGSMLNKISSFFDKDVDYAVKRMAVLIEPALLVVMGFVVGFMAMAIIIPIFKMRTTIPTG